jgi:hypothetical protein
MSARMDGIYAPSEDIVAREIEGELIIVPITSGIGDLEDELFSLNDCGRAVWVELDGCRNLVEVTERLVASFDAPAEQIGEDVLGLVSELLLRRILVEIQPG